MTLVDTPFAALERVLDGFNEIDGLLTALVCLTVDPLMEIDLRDELRGANSVAHAIRRRLDALQMEAQAAFPFVAPDRRGTPDFERFVAEAKSTGDLAPFADYLERVAGMHGYPAAVVLACRSFRGVTLPDENAGEDGDA